MQATQFTERASAGFRRDLLVLEGLVVREYVVPLELLHRQLQYQPVSLHTAMSR